MGALRDVLRCRESGLITAGVPCHAYIFMASASHGRTAERPFGREDRAFVQKANDLAARVAWLLLIALIRRTYFAVEQPSSTKLYGLPYMEWLRKCAEVLGIRFYDSFLPLR